MKLRDVPEDVSLKLGLKEKKKISQVEKENKWSRQRSVCVKVWEKVIYVEIEKDSDE